MSAPIVTYNPFTDNLDFLSNGGGGQGGYVWQSVTSLSPANPITPIHNTAYSCVGSSKVTFILPISPNFGDTYKFLSNSALFEIDQNANQQIRIGAATTTIGGSGKANSNFVGDILELTYTGNNIFISGPILGTISLT